MFSYSTIANKASVRPFTPPAPAAAKLTSSSAKSPMQAPARPASATSVATSAKPAARSTSSPSSIISPRLAAVLATASRASAATAATSPASTAGAPPKAVASSSGGFVTNGGRVIMDIAASDSGYENQIYWSKDNFATRHLVGVDNHQASIDLGEFAAGTRIDFGIVNGANQFFRTGGSTANSDGVDHTRISSNAHGTQIGFEDLLGGGDRDFNDAIIQIRSATAVPAPSTTDRHGILSAKPPATATTPPTDSGSGWPPAPVSIAPKNDNRSGLGDGTNPGQGAGTAKSPNTGTLNPSQAASPTNAAAVPASVAKLKPVAVVKSAPVKPAATPVAVAPNPIAKKSAAAAAAAAMPISSTQAKLEATKQLLASSYSALAPDACS